MDDVYQAWFDKLMDLFVAYANFVTECIAAVKEKRRHYDERKATEAAKRDTVEALRSLEGDHLSKQEGDSEQGLAGAASIGFTSSKDDEAFEVKTAQREVRMEEACDKTHLRCIHNDLNAKGSNDYNHLQLNPLLL